MSEKCDKFGEYSKMTAKVVSEKFNNFSLKCIFLLLVLFAFLFMFNKMYLDNLLLKEEKYIEYSLFNSEFIEVRNKSIFIGWKDKSKNIKTYYTVEIPLKKRQ